MRWGISPRVSQRLDDLGRRNGATFFSIRLAALVAFLGATTKQSEIILGAYMSNRGHVELQSMMGFFVNLATLRFSYSAKFSFHELLAMVGDETRATAARSGIPYEDLRSELERSGIVPPYIQIIFSTTRRRGFSKDNSLAMKKLDRRMVGMPWGFSIYFDEDDEADDCGVVFDAGIYDRKCVEMFVDEFRRFLDAVSRQPNLSLAECLPAGSDRTYSMNWPSLVGK
jgi:non-ribosomal peptide synthetase component F